jgi:hypothetical protein
MMRDVAQEIKDDYFQFQGLTSDTTALAVLVLATQLRRLEAMATDMFAEMKAADENR